MTELTRSTSIALSLIGKSRSMDGKIQLLSLPIVRGRVRVGIL
jgi:hypothetical protein